MNQNYASNSDTQKLSKKPGFSFPGWVFSICALFTLFKLWLIAGCGMTAYVFAGHDDALFVNLADRIVSGCWLGAFTQFTLMKGAGFPLFMALSYVLSIPLFIAQELLYIATCVLAIMTLRPLFKTTWPLLAIYIPLLFCPTTFSMTRVLRDHFYMSLSLGMIACAAALIVRCRTPWRKNLPWSIALGLFLAFMWHTREEGISLLPPLALAFVFMLAGNWRELSDRECRRASLTRLSVAFLVPFAILMGMNVIICSINYGKYGIFSSTEMSNSSFKTAYGTLCGVDYKHKIRYVPLSKESLRKIYEVSPAARELQPYLDGPGGEGWMQNGKELAPEITNEFKGGWFIWAFREAAANAGYYNRHKRWKDTEDFYKRLAKEVSQACKDGRLEGLGLRSSLMPIISAKDIKPWMETAWDFILKLGTLDYINISETSYSSDSTQQAETDFFERMTNCIAMKSPKTTFLGWACCSGRGFPNMIAGGESEDPISLYLMKTPIPEVSKTFGQPSANEGKICYRFKMALPSDRTLAFLDSKGKTFAPQDTPSYDETCQNGLHYNIEKVLSPPKWGLFLFKTKVKQTSLAILKHTLPWICCLSLLASLLIVAAAALSGNSAHWCVIAITATAASAVICRIAITSLVQTTSFTGYYYLTFFAPLYILTALLPAVYALFNWRTLANSFHSARAAK